MASDGFRLRRHPTRACRHRPMQGRLRQRPTAQIAPAQRRREQSASATVRGERTQSIEAVGERLIPARGSSRKSACSRRCRNSWPGE